MESSKFSSITLAKSPAGLKVAPLFISARRVIITAVGLGVAITTLALAGAGLLYLRHMDDAKSTIERALWLVGSHAQQSMGGAEAALIELAKRVTRLELNKERELKKHLSSRQSFDELRDYIKVFPQIGTAAVADARGDVILNSRAFPAPVVNLAAREHFKRHVDDPSLEVKFTTPAKSLVDGQWTIYATRRLNDIKGRFAGIVVIGIGTRFFHKYYEAISPQEGQILSLFDQTGLLLVKFPEPLARMGSRYDFEHGSALAGAAIDVEMLKANSPAQLTRGGDGGRVLTVAGTSEDGRFLVKLESGTSVFMNDWLDELKIIGIFTIVCLTIIILGTRPLHQALKRMQAASAEADVLRVREAALRRAAEQGAEAKAQFLSIVSHEMRTPLHGMLGFSDLLLEGELIDSQREVAKEIQGAAEAMLSLVNDVLIIAKLQRGKGVVEFSAMDIEILFRTIVDAHSKRALEKGIALVEDIDAGIPPLVWGAGAEIRLILDKLIDNAIKFSSGGTVTLGAVMHKVDGAPELCTMEFFVSDQGIGISQKDLDLIFQPFTQADGAIGRRFNGLGLGLNICKGLVELLGGDLAVDSVPGTGSRFQVKIPLSLVYVPTGSVTQL